MLFTVTSWICAVSALAAFFYRLPAARRSGSDPAPVALCVYFLCSSLSFLLDLNPLRSVISQALDYPSITTVISQAAVVVLTAAQQVALVHWSRQPEQARPEARRRVLVFGAALIVLVVLFFLLGPLQHYGDAQTASTMHMTERGYAAYMGLYLAICAVGQVETLRLSLHFVRIAHRPWLRRGMRLVSMGAALVLAYCAIRLVSLIGIQLGLDTSVWQPMSWLAGDLGSLLQILGWTLPAWGIRLSLAGHWFAQYRAYLRLRPLWLALCGAVPVTPLSCPASRLLGIMPPRDLTYRLYRTVIEIRDGQLALRPYMNPQAAYLGAGALRPPSAPCSPTDEALLLHTALTARSDGPRKPLEPAAAAGFVHPPHDDFAEEVRRLTEVADAFVRVARLESRRRRLR